MEWPQGSSIQDRKHTFTHGRICCCATWGLTIPQNLVTLPAAAIRTSASLSRSRRTYAGTSSVLEVEHTWPHQFQNQATHKFIYVIILKLKLPQKSSSLRRASSLTKATSWKIYIYLWLLSHKNPEFNIEFVEPTLLYPHKAKKLQYSGIINIAQFLDKHLVGSEPTASQSSYNWLATM